MLVSDFDNGMGANDALGVFYDLPGPGLGEREISMVPGDSGAPAFIDGRIAGIASFRLRLTRTDGSTSDVDDISNASFGEFNAFTRVSFYDSWIRGFSLYRKSVLQSPASPVRCLQAYCTTFGGDGNCTRAVAEWRRRDP